jgi:protein CpxP
MKKLIIALVFGLGLTGFAQETTSQQNKAGMDKMTPEQRQQKHLAHLTKELTLDAKQQEGVSKILAEKSAKAQAVKAQKEARKSSGEKMTAAEKEAFKNQMQAEKTDTEAKMKAILSADQYQKWLTIREENKEKMKEKMKEKRSGGM